MNEISSQLLITCCVRVLFSAHQLTPLLIMAQSLIGLSTAKKLNGAEGKGGVFFFLNGLPFLMDSTTNQAETDSVIAKPDSELVMNDLNDTSTTSIDCDCVLKNVPDYKPPISTNSDQSSSDEITSSITPPAGTVLTIKIQKPDQIMNVTDLRNLTIPKSLLTPLKFKKNNNNNNTNSRYLNVNNKNKIKQKMHFNHNSGLLDEISFEFDADITPLVTPLMDIEKCINNNMNNNIKHKHRFRHIKHPSFRDSTCFTPCCTMNEEVDGWWICDDYYTSQWEENELK